MLIVVAIIRSKPEALETVKASLICLVAPTRAEAGCVQYDLNQDRADPNLFVFFERWESDEALAAHAASAHIAAHQARVAGLLESADIHKMTHIA